MGKPVRHIPVKLIIGLFSSHPDCFSAATRILKNKFGKTDSETSFWDFSCTAYYEKEFGKNLKRKFLSFGKLIAPSQLYKLKLYTNRIENKFSEKSARKINIDPGYVSLTQLVLFTTKNRSHRIYCDEGIYADIELAFVENSFRALEMTYPDYRDEKCIDFFNSVRKKYFSQVACYL